MFSRGAFRLLAYTVGLHPAVELDGDDDEDDRNLLLNF